MVSGWGIRTHSRVPTFVENGIGSYTHVSEGRGRRLSNRWRERGTTNFVHRERTLLNSRRNGLWLSPAEQRGDHPSEGQPATDKPQAG